MPDGKPKAPVVRPEPMRSITLQKWERVVAIGGGVLVVAIAGVAELWARLDGVGVVAFVVAGSLAFLLGVVGRMPTRLTANDYAVEFAEIERQQEVEAAQEIVEEMPTATKELIVQSAEDNPRLELIRHLWTNAYAPHTTALRFEPAKAKEGAATPPVVEAAALSLAFEGLVEHTLKPIFMKLGYSFERGSDHAVGDFIARRDKSVVYIIARRWTRGIAPVVRDIQRIRAILVHEIGQRAVLVLNDEKIVLEARRLLLGENDVLVLSTTWDNRTIDEEARAFLLGQ